MFEMPRGPAVSLVCAAALGVCLSGQDSESIDAATVAQRAGDSVEAYLAVARTILARESVTIQPLSADLAEIGVARRLVYDTRVEWEPQVADRLPEAAVHRTLVSIDGRPPMGRPEESCLPRRASEPLAFLLVPQRSAYTFSLTREDRARRDPALVLEYVPRSPGAPSLVWRGDCGSFDLPGRARGRVFLDASTFAVRRIEQRLTQPVRMPVPRDQRRDGWHETILVERADVEMAYEPVQFRQPDETLMQPVEIRRVTVVRTPELRALRVTQRLSNYRRFVTDVRVVPVPLKR